MILVTGANGQLGLCLEKELETAVFKTKTDLDILDLDAIKKACEENQITAIINCAAYTQVDKSEEEKELAEKVNKDGAKNLATVSKELNLKLIHISTDYVFDGSQNTPYKESDSTSPLGVYGSTKLAGEQEVQNICEEYIIIRTSWLYSEFQKNFVKTMFKLLQEKPKLNIVFDQVGSPTYARDLAVAIQKIIPQINKENSGIYHYGNQGVASWFDLTVAIKELLSANCELGAIESHEYPTPAKRPHYSVFNTKKIRETFNIQIPYWKESLKLCLQRIS